MIKRIITFLICIALCLFTYTEIDAITIYAKKWFKTTPSVVLDQKNEYSKGIDYKFVSISKDFIPYNYQDLLNIFYTILDYHYNNFTFYCPPEYEDCINDVNKISDESNVEVLTTLGNYVSPFNNFSSLRVQYDTAGEVTVEISYLYDDEDIKSINAELDKIWNEIVKEDMDDEDIIYAFHDYIINKTRYDDEYENELKQNGTTTHKADKANGPLFEGYGICSGYTDTMALVLDRLKIPNFKLASSTHVWNVVYINDNWLHLDLTWDDPVSQDHSVNNLLHKFFLIDSETLESFDIVDHTYDKSIYLELR